MSNSIAYFYNELNRDMVRQKQLEEVYEAVQQCDKLDRYYLEQSLTLRFDTVVNGQLLDNIAKHINRNRIRRECLNWADIQIHHVNYLDKMTIKVTTLGEPKPKSIARFIESALADMRRLCVDEAFIVTSKWGTYYTLFSEKGSKSYFCIYGDEKKSWGLSLDYTYAEDALQYIKENGKDHGRFYKVIDGKGNLYAMGKTGRV